MDKRNEWKVEIYLNCKNSDYYKDFDEVLKWVNDPDFGYADCDTINGEKRMQKLVKYLLNGWIKNEIGKMNWNKVPEVLKMIMIKKLNIKCREYFIFNENVGEEWYDDDKMNDR